MIITMTTRWKRAVFFFFPLSFRAQLPSCPSISTDRAIDPILKPIRSYVSTNFRIGGNWIGWANRFDEFSKKFRSRKFIRFFEWTTNRNGRKILETRKIRLQFIGKKVSWGGDLFRAVIRFLFIVIPAKRAIFLIREFSIGSGGADIIPRRVISIRLGGT